MFIISRKPADIKDLHCGCGKPADVAWFLPAKKREVQKMSKIQSAPLPEPQPTLYGRSCEAHIPPGVV